MGAVVTEPEDPQDKAYLISFGECSIVRCRGKGRKGKKPADDSQPPEPDGPPNQG